MTGISQFIKSRHQKPANRIATSSNTLLETERVKIATTKSQLLSLVSQVDGPQMSNSNNAGQQQEEEEKGSQVCQSKQAEDSAKHPKIDGKSILVSNLVNSEIIDVVQQKSSLTRLEAQFQQEIVALEPLKVETPQNGQNQTKPSDSGRVHDMGIEKIAQCLDQDCLNSPSEHQAGKDGDLKD